MGTYLTGEVSVIHNETTADFDNFVYSAVYFNSIGPFEINGNTGIAGVVGETLEVVVDGSTTSLDGNNLLLLGNSKTKGIFKTGLMTKTGSTEQYQFVNINTGLPTNG